MSRLSAAPHFPSVGFQDWVSGVIPGWPRELAVCSHSDLELPVLPSHFSISRLVGDTATPSLVLFLFLVELPNVFDVDLRTTLRSCQLSSCLLPINSVPSLSDGIFFE